jgi:SAM-dependent methyltransferase
MSGPPKPAATSIWDDRYREGKLACAQERVESDPIDYTQHPFLYQHAIAKRLTGSLDGNPLDLIAQRFFRPPARKMLALGSGMAFVEQWFVEGGHVEHVLAFEQSAVAVEAAKQRIAKAGLAARIELRADDVMHAGLDPGQYDVVMVQASLHHFFNIEEMFALMHSVLKPGGLLVYDEYVGPDHHMYEPEVMALMDEVNACLAPAYRFDVLRQETREQIPRGTLEWMKNMDPSEGVHASMILPLTYKYFDVEYRGDFGGAFMRPFFVGILPNFDFGDPKDQTVARLIVLVEELLTRYAVIPNYHTRVVARRRDVPRTDVAPADLQRINYADWPGLPK